MGGWGLGIGAEEKKAEDEDDDDNLDWEQAQVGLFKCRLSRSSCSL